MYMGYILPNEFDKHIIQLFAVIARKSLTEIPVSVRLFDFKEQ
jgi:hypothetical protein